MIVAAGRFDQTDFGVIRSLGLSLQRLDLAGIAGNQRPQRGQLTWWLDPAGQWEKPYRSGALAHGSPNHWQATGLAGRRRCNSTSWATPAAWGPTGSTR